MPYTIGKRFRFDAGHSLPSPPLDPDDKCARFHGHSYTVEVILRADTLDECGMVVNFHDLAPFKTYLDTSFDHRFLNDVLGSGALTTSELLAQYFYDYAHRLWPQVVAVLVSEGGSSWAEYRP